MTVRRRRRAGARRLMRWLWTSRRPDARLVRGALVPASFLYRGVMAVRAAAYRRRWLAIRDVGLPIVSVGNLTLGGSGKGTVAEWIVRRYLGLGLRPALAAPVGDDGDALVHRHALPGAVVLTERDPVAAAERAIAQGADVLVLDDVYQRLDVHRDLTLAVLSAETSRAVRWTLPAGPWREGWAALRRADAAIVTRKRAPPEVAEAFAAEVEECVAGPVGIARISLAHLEGLVTGRREAAAVLQGKRVVAATGIADPHAFIAATKATGAAVQVATWAGRRDFRDEDVAWLAHAARRADHVVITSKDAVKLRDRWPHRVPEPLVALVELTWERGVDAIAAALDAAVTPVDRF